MRQKTKLSALLTCHNRCPLTLACLASLYQQRLPDDVELGVFLVDDGSSDGTAEAVQQQFPRVNVIQGDGSLFWNRGMHKAFAAAIEHDSDFYVWLNDDCRLYPDTIAVLLRTYDELNKLTGSCAHIIGSAMQDPTTGEFSYGGVKKYATTLGRIKQIRIAPKPDKAQECQAVNGNCVLISREVVARIGNLDPVFTHRWGDHDYCFRALDAGCQVWLAPGYRGTCKANPVAGTWEDVRLPIGKRLRALRSQRGYAPQDYKIYLQRHRGRWWWLNYLAPYIKIAVSQVTGRLRPQ